MKKYLVLILLLPLLSCDKWLDVRPNDRISEGATFSSRRGFEMAVNGVYLDLNKSGLYGKALSYELIEILAQRYNINADATYNMAALKFDYGSIEMKSRVSNIWIQAYELIANINMVLKNCEEHKEVLSYDYYKLIKGEMLTARAMLHFDLFRLFGPIYDDEYSVKVMPYYTEFSLKPKEKITSKEFMTNVIQDLKEAIKFLDEDPIKNGYSLKGDDVNRFKGFRVLRFNYYAANLLLARANLYVGDKENALSFAKEIINVQEDYFPWVSPSVLTATLEEPDLVFSSEVLFSLQNTNRTNVYKNYFNPDNLRHASILIPRDRVISRIFDNEFHDYRYKSWLSKTVDYGNTSYRVFTKYSSVSSDSLYNQLLPMMRVSEAYYIAAETEPNPNIAKSYLNKVLNARGLQNMPPYYEVGWILDSEYAREFWGEGQLFFYYKRKAMEEIQSSENPYKKIKMKRENYVLIIPDEEIKYN